MTIEKTVFEDGKYTVVQNEGRTTILRYEETWRDATGDKFINAVVDEVKRLRAALKEINDLATTEPMDHPSRAMSFKVRVRDLSEAA